MKAEINFLRSVAEYAPELTKERAVELKKSARHQNDRKALDSLIASLEPEEAVIEKPIFTVDDSDIIDADRLGVLAGDFNEDA